MTEPQFDPVSGERLSDEARAQRAWDALRRAIPGRPPELPLTRVLRRGESQEMRTYEFVFGEDGNGVHVTLGNGRQMQDWKLVRGLVWDAIGEAEQPPLTTKAPDWALVLRFIWRVAEPVEGPMSEEDELRADLSEWMVSREGNGRKRSDEDPYAHLVVSDEDGAEAAAYLRDGVWVREGRVILVPADFVSYLSARRRTSSQAVYRLAGRLGFIRPAERRGRMSLRDKNGKQYQPRALISPIGWRP